MPSCVRREQGVGREGEGVGRNDGKEREGIEGDSVCIFKFSLE